MLLKQSQPNNELLALLLPLPQGVVRLVIVPNSKG